MLIKRKPQETCDRFLELVNNLYLLLLELKDKVSGYGIGEGASVKQVYKAAPSGVKEIMNQIAWLNSNIETILQDLYKGKIDMCEAFIHNNKPEFFVPFAQHFHEIERVFRGLGTTRHESYKFFSKLLKHWNRRNASNIQWEWALKQIDFATNFFEQVLKRAKLSKNLDEEFFKKHKEDIVELWNIIQSIEINIKKKNPNLKEERLVDIYKNYDINFVKLYVKDFLAKSKSLIKKYNSHKKKIRKSVGSRKINETLENLFKELSILSNLLKFKKKFIVFDNLPNTTLHQLRKEIYNLRSILSSLGIKVTNPQRVRESIKIRLLNSTKESYKSLKSFIEGLKVRLTSAQGKLTKAQLKDWDLWRPFLAFFSQLETFAKENNKLSESFEKFPKPLKRKMGLLINFYRDKNGKIITKNGKIYFEISDTYLEKVKIDKFFPISDLSQVLLALHYELTKS